MPLNALRQEEPIAFSPRLRARDEVGSYWLRQATLRLRREILWLWHERGTLAGATAVAALPPLADRLSDALDLARYDADKRAFFGHDATARFLGDAIAAAAPVERAAPRPPRGSFGWLVRELELARVECFALAAALLPAVDSAAGSVIATCLNDAACTAPTLALVQRLWDEPDAVLACLEPGHALARYGLLSPPPATWDAPLAVPAIIARALLYPGAGVPAALVPLARAPIPSGADADVALAAARLDARSSDGIAVLPILGLDGAPLADVAAACAAQRGRSVVTLRSAVRAAELPPLLTAAWLQDADVYLPLERLPGTIDEHHGAEALSLPRLPLTIFAGVHDRAQLARLRDAELLPPISVPPLSYAERLATWRELVPRPDTELDAALAEAARRYRYERAPIRRAAAALARLGRPPTPADVLAACRTDLDLGALAQKVTPRFRLGELMLPPAQTRQIEEMVTAMRNLTRVHYEWGTARPWNESGLAALFAGPPGTGKTMCAEAFGAELDIPVYRIDLSQVVNKYIGETEKNLRRLFDAAEAADVILFFDEADALFGKRTEVRDAHDRYANLEVSYLLERMERFRGLAILATNRRKDLDEAFLRRLRFVVDFPLPGPAERRRIWAGVIPAGVDATALDLDFLAQRFTLSGGHIRAVVFHACLQSATAGAPRVLGMPAVIRAVKREYDKLDRTASLDQFGPYAALVAEDTRT